MKANNMDTFTCIKILCIILMGLGMSQLYAKNSLDDQALSEQSDGLAKLSPIIINVIKQSVHQPIEEQNKQHKQIAKERTDQANKDEIYTTVLTDYEWQKKDYDSNKPTDKYLKPFEKYRYFEMGYNPYQRHDVKITTNDRVTLYVGHEIDGIGFR